MTESWVGKTDAQVMADVDAMLTGVMALVPAPDAYTMLMPSRRVEIERAFIEAEIAVAAAQTAGVTDPRKLKRIRRKLREAAMRTVAYRAMITEATKEQGQ